MEQNQSVHFITESRDDIVGMTRYLMRAIDFEFLNDRQKPIIVRVIGSYRSGKKIIPDEAVSMFLKGSAPMSGNKDHDEFYHGREMCSMDISFINLGWSSGFSKEIRDERCRYLSTVWLHEDFNAAALYTAMVSVLENKRKAGGLVFIHNDKAACTDPDLEIYIDKIRKSEEIADHDLPRLRRDRVVSESLLHLKKQDIKTPERYVEVCVLSERLRLSPLFMRAVQNLEGTANSEIQNVRRYAFTRPERAGWT